MTAWGCPRTQNASVDSELTLLYHDCDDLALLRFVGEALRRFETRFIGAIDDGKRTPVIQRFPPLIINLPRPIWIVCLTPEPGSRKRHHLALLTG
jgi:hypothetical protein